MYAKGNYFSFARRPVFSRLIYPTPVDGGLGVHVTLDLAGRMRFGPDVEWIAAESYSIDPRRADSVLRAHPQLLAGPAGRLAGAGLLRHSARTHRPGRSRPPRSRYFPGPPAHSMPRLVNLFGMKSPGLTASLSIAEAAGEISGLARP